MTDEPVFKPEIELTDAPPEDAILLCPRVVDLPIPSTPGRIAICTGGCLERVWVANSSPQNLKVVCISCGEETLRQDPGPHQLAITPRQIQDVLRWRREQLAKRRG